MDHTSADDRIVIIKSDHIQMLHDYGAFYLKGQNRAFYIDAKQSAIPGKTMIDANSYFIGRILRAAIQQLDTYLRAHMSDLEIYNTELFWKDALKYAGRRIMPHPLWIDYRTVPFGYLLIHNSNCSKSMCYPFVASAAVPQKDDEKNSHEATPMELCYHGLLDQMLAQRHAQAGVAPAAYAEIAGINDFLKNKRSVHGIWKDGVDCLSFERDPFTADALFCMANGRLAVHTSGYREPPKSDDGLPTQLRHYGVPFPIRTEVLETLNLFEAPAPKEKPKHGPEEQNATNLLPPSVQERLKQNPLYSKDKLGKNAPVIVKYFNPCGTGT